MSDFLEVVLEILLIFVISAVIGLFAAVLVMWIWNAIMPELFASPTISYRQAYGLYFLCSLLLKSAGSHSSKS